MKIKPAFVLWNYRNVKSGWRYFRVLGQSVKGLSLFGCANSTFGIKATPISGPKAK